MRYFSAPEKNSSSVGGRDLWWAVSTTTYKQCESALISNVTRPGDARSRSKFSEPKLKQSIFRYLRFFSSGSIFTRFEGRGTSSSNRAREQLTSSRASDSNLGQHSTMARKWAENLSSRRPSSVSEVRELPKCFRRGNMPPLKVMSGFGLGGVIHIY